jgi:hypothetical protein
LVSAIDPASSKNQAADRQLPRSEVFRRTRLYLHADRQLPRSLGSPNSEIAGTDLRPGSDQVPLSVFFYASPVFISSTRFWFSTNPPISDALLRSASNLRPKGRPSSSSFIQSRGIRFSFSIHASSSSSSADPHQTSPFHLYRSNLISFQSRSHALKSTISFVCRHHRFCFQLSRS